VMSEGLYSVSSNSAAAIGFPGGLNLAIGSVINNDKI